VILDVFDLALDAPEGYLVDCVDLALDAAQVV